MKSSTRKIRHASLILRLGLASVFLYAAVAALINPADWIGYIPSFATHLISNSALLKFFSIFQIALSVWLLSNRYIKYAAFLSALLMVGIIFSDIHLFAATFRDMAIAASGLALAVLSD